MCFEEIIPDKFHENLSTVQSRHLQEKPWGKQPVTGGELYTALLSWNISSLKWRGVLIILKGTYICYIWMCHIYTSVTCVYTLIIWHASCKKKFMLVALLSLEFCGTWRTVKEIPPDQYQLWQEECLRKQGRLPWEVSESGTVVRLV